MTGPAPEMMQRHLQQQQQQQHQQQPPPTSFHTDQATQPQSVQHQGPPPPQGQPPASSSHPGGGAPSSQTPGHPSFRRQRASRACETCHARKVRCDAASLGVPCTNCVAFSIECKIPAPKRKRTQGKSRDSDSERGDNPNDNLQPEPDSAANSEDGHDKDWVHASEQAIIDIKRADAFSESEEKHVGTYASAMKPKFVRAPIKEAGRVAYLGESSNLSLLVHDRNGTTDVVHYPLPENVRGTRARLNELDNIEIDILHTRGAFLLPPRGLCDELVDAYFTWIAPVTPVINRSKFMRKYRDSKNPPSLLLLQAILLAGSRVCKNPQLMDSNGSTTPAAMTFYKRAKALFDANYEDDRVTIVQAAILLGWYWEGPEDVTRNVFYWSRVATIVAQGSGMHRSVESSQLSRVDKRLWKRIWWTLFTRDRSVAVALGRPCGINTDDSDVEMLTEDDFNDDDVDKPAEYPNDPVHVQFFLNYVKLTEIMGLVLSQQYSVACKIKKHNALDLTHADMALADWLQNCPKEVFWERPRHHFWSALLHANYYTTLCLLHRAHMPPAGTPTTTVQNGVVVETAYPSRNIAYQAAGMITSIIESLQTHDQIRFTPAFVVYSLFSALIMHIYQLRSTNAAIVSATEQRMHSCMEALKEVSKVWLVAKMVHTLFESILGNKTLEERLHKAAGRKAFKPKLTKSRPAEHQPNQQQHNMQRPPDSGSKRKFDEVDMGYTNGAPSAQVSYERSRPQTPTLSAAQEPPGMHQQQQMPVMAPPTNTGPTSPNMIRDDAFMGNSRNTTRATTPFNPTGASYPGTPPDLYLVTRDSPTISHNVWNNFEPNRLFPAETNLTMPNMSPNQAHAFIDPQLGTQQQQMPSSSGAVNPMQQQGMQQTFQMQQPQQNFNPPHPNMTHQANGGSASSMHDPSAGLPTRAPTNPGSWAQINALNASAQRQQQQQQQHQQQQQPRQGGALSSDDSWSNSSVGGAQVPPAPTTLNVEDWFQFFGINGEMNPISAAGFGG